MATNNSINIPELLSCGVSLYESNDINGALNQFLLVLELDPTNLDALRKLAYCYLENANYEYAIAESTKILNLCQDDSPSRLIRAESYFNLLKIEEAILDLEVYVDLESDDDYGWQLLVLCYISSNKINSARQANKAARQLFIDHVFFETMELKFDFNDKTVVGDTVPSAVRKSQPE